MRDAVNFAVALLRRVLQTVRPTLQALAASGGPLLDDALGFWHGSPADRAPDPARRDFIPGGFLRRRHLLQP